MTGSLVPNKKSTHPIPAPSIEGAVDTFYSHEPEPGTGQLTRIFAALRRFAWLIALITVVGSALSVLATRFIKPTYVVTTTLYLQNTRQLGNGPIQAPEIVSSYNWVELARTFAVLDTVVKEVKLYLQPMGKHPAGFFDGFELASRYQPGEYRLKVDAQGKRYALLLGSGVELTGGPVTDSVGKAAGFLWRPGPEKLSKNLEVRFRVLTLRDAAFDLRNRLRANLNSEAGSFLIVSLAGTNPKLIAETINVFQRQFVAVAADLKKVKLRELSNVLQDQLRQQEAKLRDAEQALESFKVATVTQPREDVAVASGISVTQNTAYSRYFAQRIDLENIRTDRQAIESALGRLVAGQTTVDAFSTIPAARNSRDLNRVLEELSASQAELRSLKQKYTDEFKGVKDIQEKIQTLTSVTIPAYAQALAQSLRIQERELEARNLAAGVELRNIPVRAITEARLTRDMESSRNLTQNLQNRYEENKLAELSAIPDITILDEASVPTRPIGNEAPRIIMLGVFASLGVGLGLAVLLDRLDKRFRYPEQASSELGLSILGAIPAIPKPRNGKKVDHTEMHQVIEAFRSVRLNLAHSFNPEEPICLTISSPSPGDGKSLVAANLALSFAEGGYRTLLIDGDIRRGDLHRTFGAERRPGLLDYLGSSQLPLERVFRETSHERLTLIPCGTRLQYGPELLSSARMADLIAKLRDQFEVIVADSPPLGAGIDPFLLGTHLGNLLIVLRTGETDREMAEAKLRMLERLPIRILGAVLNHIKAGVGPYKYYSYSYGYAAENEISEGQEKEVLASGT